MILADKIINERKKNGWSQEELAEQLSVSRQSVSKWEGAQAVPDLQKIIAMANIFGVSTDYLLKDELEPEDKPVSNVVVEESISSEDIRKVSLEEANDYLEIARRNTPKIANGVSLCIISPVILILLAGLSEAPSLGISEKVAAVVGVLSLLVIVAVAVYMFIVFGAQLSKYSYIEHERIETAYGVAGMVAERKKSLESRKTTGTAVGVMLCILSAIPLLVTACLELPDYIIVSMVCVLLIIVAIAVNMFVRISGEWDRCNQLLQEDYFTIKNKASNKIVGRVGGAYWGIVLAIYLGWSFTTMRWENTWIVWPVAAVLFGAITCIIKAVMGSDNN